MERDAKNTRGRRTLIASPLFENSGVFRGTNATNRPTERRRGDKGDGGEAGGAPGLPLSSVQKFDGPENRRNDTFSNCCCVLQNIQSGGIRCCVLFISPYLHSLIILDDIVVNMSRGICILVVVCVSFVGTTSTKERSLQGGEKKVAIKIPIIHTVDYVLETTVIIR